jgi:hypothetical protein
MGMLAAGDHPGPLGPARQVHVVGDLDDLGDLGGQRMADNETDTTFAAGVEEPVRTPSRVRPGDHLDQIRIDRQLKQRVIEHGDVICGGAMSVASRPTT